MCKAGSASRALAGISADSEQGTDLPSPASPVWGYQLSQGRIPSSVLHLEDVQTHATFKACFSVQHGKYSFRNP